MALMRLRSEEKTGLMVALVLHLLLLAGILVQMLIPAPEPVAVQPTVVSLTEEVGLEAASPQPVPVSREAVAPTLSDIPELPPLPQDIAPAPAPEPRPVPTTAPRRQVAPAPAPRPRTERAPPRPRPSARPTRSGGSRIGDDFLPGAGSNSETSETRAPARTFGRAEQAALSQAINRQLQPHWRGRAPQGLDAEQLVTVLAWEMNADGSLAGRPRVVSQSGITDANRAQAERHAEIAIRAVQLAAPFNLPDEFYDKWKRVSSWRFDRRL